MRTITFGKLAITWKYHGAVHRDNDLPAKEWYYGLQYWYRHGYIHRIDGPACSDNGDNDQYWLYGKQMSQEQWEMQVWSIRKTAALQSKKAMRVMQLETRLQTHGIYNIWRALPR